jgi:hypothetical protein
LDATGWLDFTLPSTCHLASGEAITPSFFLEILMDGVKLFDEAFARDDSMWGGRVLVVKAFPLSPTASAHDHVFTADSLAVCAEVGEVVTVHSLDLDVVAIG